MMRKRIGRAAQALARKCDHGVRYVDAVNLCEVAAQRTHESAWSATNFEGGVASRKPRQIHLQPANDVATSREKLGLVLPAAAECDIVIGVFAGALVPIGAHAF